MNRVSLSTNIRLHAEVMLLVSTLFWATTFPAMKWLLDRGITVWEVVAIRCFLAAAVAFAWWPHEIRWRGNERDWAITLRLGLCVGLAFVTNTLGIAHTTAGRAAFITALFLVFVPLLQAGILRQPPSALTWLGVLVATLGLALLTNPIGGELRTGDLWALGSAVGYSFYIIELQRWGRQVHLGRLLFGQFVFIGTIGLMGAAMQGSFSLQHGGAAWSVLIYLSVVCSFFGTLLHNRFQPDTTAVRAALLFTAEPVFAASLAWWLLGERLTPWNMFGGALIIGAIAALELMKSREE